MDTSGNILHFPPVLIKQAAQGDPVAFKELYQMISGKMYSLCLRYASNTEDANDLFQEGFIKLYRHLSNYRFEGSFEGWARTIFVTTCLDSLKKKKVQFTEVSEEIALESKGISAIDKLDMDDLMKIVRQLPDGYRTIVNLYLIEDYSHKEIAGILGITESGSKSKLHKARNLLKQKITAENI